MLCRFGPVCPESLQSFGVPYVRSHDFAVRQQDRRRGRYPKRRAVLERRNAVTSPTEPPNPLGPVETVGVCVQGGAYEFGLGFVHKEDIGGVLF